MISLLQSDSLTKNPFIQHGFSTRQGGVSTGYFDSLNTSYDKGDPSENVTENRRRICLALDHASSPLITAKQIHSNHVVVVNAPFTEELPEADALITTTPNISIAVTTADCAPILLADTTGKAVAAIHAGWRGASSGIIENTVSLMLDLGCQPKELSAAIGPCIWQNSYEVSQDFYDSFSKNKSFFKTGNRPGHWYFDLPGFVVSTLEKTGIQNFSLAPYDTFTHKDLFFSNRRRTLNNEPQFGCSLSVIKIRTRS